MHNLDFESKLSGSVCQPSFHLMMEKLGTKNGVQVRLLHKPHELKLDDEDARNQEQYLKSSQVIPIPRDNSMEVDFASAITRHGTWQ